MKHTHYVYRMGAVLTLSYGEWQQLVSLAINHYDAKCREAGSGTGLLAEHRWADWRDPSDKSVPAWKNPITDCVAEVRFDWDELDLLCKITEHHTSRELHGVFHATLSRLEDERARITGSKLVSVRPVEEQR